MFGSDAIERWGDETFYYRTGIALNLWSKGVGRVRL